MTYKDRFTPVRGGTMELLRDMDGLSYRQLDRWIRRGWVTVARGANGSGTRRQVSPAEAAAIRDVTEELARIDAATAAVKSGQFFANALARHKAVA